LRSRLLWIQKHPKSNESPADARPYLAFGLVALIMVPVAFLMVGAGLAWRDMETLTTWRETPATILDRREVIKSESRKQTGRRRRTSTTRTPEFALKYQAGELEMISSGFDTGTSLHIGGQVMGKAELDDWVAGKTIPCWDDPTDPGQVVVRRGFGGAYVFFLIPLPILWFGLRQMREVGESVRRLEELESGAGWSPVGAP
jgi:hypothetical protein